MKFQDSGLADHRFTGIGKFRLTTVHGDKVQLPFELKAYV